MTQLQMIWWFIKLIGCIIIGILVYRDIKEADGYLKTAKIIACIIGFYFGFKYW